MLAVPLGYVDVGRRGVGGGKVWVVNQEMECLTGEKVPLRLDKAQRELLVRAIEMLKDNAEGIYRRLDNLDT